MKKLFTMILAFTLCLSSLTSVFAEKKTDGDYEREESEFSVIEYDKDGSEVREVKLNKSDKFNKSFGMNIFNGKNDIKKAEDILRALGLDEEDIRNMPSEEKVKYLLADELSSVTTYSKFSSNGVETKLTKEDALKAINAASQNEILFNDIKLEADFSSMTSIRSSASEQDSYMRQTLIGYQVSGTEEVFHSYSCKWLKTPLMRFKDIMAIKNTSTTITPNSQYSYMTYKFYSSVGSGVRTIYGSDYTINYEKGVAVTFNLPGDHSSINNNFYHYLSYRGKMKLPGQINNFNVFGIYGHQKISIGFQPSINFGTSGAGADVVISPTYAIDQRDIYIEARYTP